MKYVLLLITAATITLFQLSAIAKSNDDKTIAEHVKQLLVQESDIQNTKIVVDVKDKIVTLSGVVDTDLQANRIVELAASVKSVIDVDAKNLQVKNSKKFLSDAFITAKTKGKIKYLAINSKISKNYSLHVETTDKIVHIFGDVSNIRDIVIIKKSINDIADVSDVKMNIQVRRD